MKISYRIEAEAGGVVDGIDDGMIDESVAEFWRVECLFGLAAKNLYAFYLTRGAGIFDNRLENDPVDDNGADAAT